MVVVVVIDMATTGGSADRIGDTTTVRTGPGAIRTMDSATDATTAITINLTTITVLTIPARTIAIETTAVR